MPFCLSGLISVSDMQEHLESLYAGRTVAHPPLDKASGPEGKHPPKLLLEHSSCIGLHNHRSIGLGYFGSGPEFR